MKNNILYKNIFLQTLTYLRLNLLKVYKCMTFRSAWDYDRLKFEWHMCGLSRSNSILFVGVHERSFVYQLAFNFDFCDIEATYLLADNKRVFCENCIDLEKEYDLVILSGVLNYGTDASFFRKILTKKNFKAYLILDWLKSMKEHIWLSQGAHFKKMRHTFYYYYTNCEND